VVVGVVTWVIGIVVAIALLVVGGGTFFSAVPGRFRKAAPKPDESVDGVAGNPDRPVAVSWHDRGFDKPR
jgi:hypothetical protein